MISDSIFGPWSKFNKVIEVPVDLSGRLVGIRGLRKFVYFLDLQIQTSKSQIRRPFRPGRRVGVHFVYHLPEVIVRRNALLVKSQTGKCQGRGGWARVWLTSVDFPTFSRFRRQEYVNLATISNVLVKNMSISQQ